MSPKMVGVERIELSFLRYQHSFLTVGRYAYLLKWWEFMELNHPTAASHIYVNGFTVHREEKLP